MKCFPLHRQCRQRSGYGRHSHNEKEQEARSASVRAVELQQTVHKAGQSERGSGQYFQIDNSRGTPADKAGRQKKPQEREKTLNQEKVVLQAKDFL